MKLRLGLGMATSLPSPGSWEIGVLHLDSGSGAIRRSKVLRLGVLGQRHKLGQTRNCRICCRSVVGVEEGEKEVVEGELDSYGLNENGRLSAYVNGNGNGSAVVNLADKARDDNGNANENGMPSVMEVVGEAQVTSYPKAEAKDGLLVSTRVEEKKRKTIDEIGQEEAWFKNAGENQPKVLSTLSTVSRNHN